ncbi:MAG: choice-of-anchor Q domain-containing protein [Myxococcota bacterium]
MATVEASSAPTDGGDYRLQMSSPARDSGDSTANDSATDLAGENRLRGPTIDLGAFEFP